MTAQVVALTSRAFVYVIGDPEGPQKVGVANDVTKRLASLQTGNPRPLACASFFEIQNDAGEVERYAHWLLRDQKVRGEWFNVTPAEAASAVAEAKSAVERGERAPRSERSAQPPQWSRKNCTHPWQLRARAAGLTQARLARLLGHAELTVSRQLRGHWDSGIPLHVRFAIMAWELMTPAQREALSDAIDAEIKASAGDAP